MAVVPDVHDLLHWANRSEVAREITRRGYRVSVETLNRWHRDRKEVPAVVERIVFELFGVGHKETPPPEWAEALPGMVADQVIERLVSDPDRLSRILEGQLARSGLLPAAGPGEESEAPPAGGGTRRRRSA